MNTMKRLIVTIYLLTTILITSFSQNQGWNMVENIITGLVPVEFPDKVYDITAMGAAGDGKTPCQEIFEKAITLCSENGGGTVKVPAGVYYMNGPLVLKSNVNIHLEKNSVLSFSSNEDDYLPAVLTRWEGTEVYNYSPLIYAYHVNNIAITGEGTINGNGSKNFSKWKRQQKTDQQMLRKMGQTNIPVYRRVFGEASKLRPGFIEPFGCTNVKIEGITIKDSPFWVIHPIFCNNVIIRGVTVESYNTNNDGCDPESCRNVLIENCVFSTGDDAIAIKSGRDNDAWRVGQPTENVVIRNCTFKSKINGVCIGSEIAGGVRDVFIENIKIPKSSNAIYFKSNLNRGGYISNIYIRNIEADTVRTALIRFEPNYKGERSSFNPTLFDNFAIENVSCRVSEECGIYLSGFKEKPLMNIYLKDITIDKTDVPYCMNNAQNVIFKNVKVNKSKLDTNPENNKIIKLGIF